MAPSVPFRALLSVITTSNNPDLSGQRLRRIEVPALDGPHAAKSPGTFAGGWRPQPFATTVAIGRMVDVVARGSGTGPFSAASVRSMLMGS